MNIFDDLRRKFMFLTFLTDQEIDNFMLIVRSVAARSSITPDEILQYIDEESISQLAFC